MTTFSASTVFEEATPAILAAKVLGALVGSLISIAYILPRGRREAALRLSVGMATGLVFGGTAGVKLADTLGLLGKVSAFEITLVGAAFASLSAWWGLGALRRLSEHWPPTHRASRKSSIQDRESSR